MNRHDALVFLLTEIGESLLMDLLDGRLNEEQYDYLSQTAIDALKSLNVSKYEIDRAVESL